jgi:ABC-type Fe3+-hydroxamate transport system substrate-binding protein
MFQKTRRRPVLLGVGIALSIVSASSCGSDDGGAATPADEPSVSQPSTSASVPPSAGGAAAAELPDGWIELLDELRCSDTTVGEFPRTIEHDGGSTTLDAPPERVVSIEGTTSLDMLLLMGVTPAAAGADYQDPFRIAPWQAALTNGDREAPGFDLIAKRPEVNIEQIAGAQPDLIISQSGWIEDILGPVEEIGAPIVVFDWTDDKVDWRDNVRIVGEAVGRDACVEEIISKVERKIDETRAAIEAAGGADDSFTVVTAGEGYIAYHGANDPVGKAIQDDLGLTLEPADGSQTEFGVELAESVLVGDNILAFEFGESFPFDQTFLEEPTVRDVADRFVLMDETVSNAGYYPSALGYYMWLDWFADEFGTPS